MARPTDGPANWATDANYPAGPEPEAGTPTKAAYTTGQATIGYRPDQIPTAQEENKFKNLVGQWTAYLKDITEPKWKWIPAGAGQHANSPAPLGTFLGIGFYGEVGEVNSLTLSPDLPEGARVLKLGIRFRNSTGEAGGGGQNGGCTISRLVIPGDGLVDPNASAAGLEADPPSGSAGETIILTDENTPGEWETIIVDVDQDGDVVVSSTDVFVLSGYISGDGIIAAIGIQYQLDA